MLLLGFVYLLVRRVISPRIPLSYLGTAALISLLFYPAGVNPLMWTAYQLLSGGLIMGAIIFRHRSHHHPRHTPGADYVWCGMRPSYHAAAVSRLLPGRCGLGNSDHELPGMAHGPDGSAPSVRHRQLYGHPQLGGRSTQQPVGN